MIIRKPNRKMAAWGPRRLPFWASILSPENERGDDIEGLLTLKL